MISLLMLVGFQTTPPGAPKLEDLSSEISRQREGRVREFVGELARASGARLRDDTGRTLGAEELLGPCFAQRISANGSVHVSFIRGIGVLRSNGDIRIEMDAHPGLPAGARSWTPAECRQAAENVATALMPAELKVRTVVPTGDFAHFLRVEIVARIEPRTLVSKMDLEIDTVTGMPRAAERNRRWPAIDPVRIAPLVSEEECAAEADRVYRSVAPYPLADRIPGRYSYGTTAPGQLSELTDEHRRLLAAKEYTVIYSQTYRQIGKPGARQHVIVDARTGKAFSWVEPSDTLGAQDRTEAAAFDPRSEWSLGTAKGRFEPVEGVVVSRSSHLLRSDDGRLLHVLLDPDRGLVEILGKTYRPDTALLEAMRAQRPVRPFGKKGG